METASNVATLYRWEITAGHTPCNMYNISSGKPRSLSSVNEHTGEHKAIYNSMEIVRNGKNFCLQFAKLTEVFYCQSFYCMV